MTTGPGVGGVGEGGGDGAPGEGAGVGATLHADVVESIHLLSVLFHMHGILYESSGGLILGQVLHVSGQLFRTSVNSSEV